jgi:prevent-host-death family protein
MQLSVSKSEFKPKALAYLRQVEKTGKSLIITHHNKPVIKISPAKPLSQEEILQSLRGSVTYHGDIVAPIADQGWEVLK